MKAKPFLWILLVLATAGGVVLYAVNDGAAPSPERPAYCVILHGLGRTSRSMRPMERSLREAGYDVLNFAYPSTKEDVTALVRRLETAIEQHCTNELDRVDFVGHSLGGMLVRCFLQRNPDFPVGRVVMLSPPNQGSEVADTLRNWWPYQAATGPMGQRLGTGTNDLPQQLPPVTYEVGVITGDRTLNPLYSAWVKGADDGKVSVERAKLSGMRDFLVVHASHTFIMRRHDVIDQVLTFLAEGRFRHAGQPDRD